MTMSLASMGTTPLNQSMCYIRKHYHWRESDSTEITITPIDNLVWSEGKFTRRRTEQSRLVKRRDETQKLPQIEEFSLFFPSGTELDLRLKKEIRIVVVAADKRRFFILPIDEEQEFPVKQRDKTNYCSSSEFGATISSYSSSPFFLCRSSFSFARFFRPDRCHLYFRPAERWRTRVLFSLHNSLWKLPLWRRMPHSLSCVFSCPCSLRNDYHFLFSRQKKAIKSIRRIESVFHISMCAEHLSVGNIHLSSSVGTSRRFLSFLFCSCICIYIWRQQE